LLIGCTRGIRAIGKQSVQLIQVAKQLRIVSASAEVEKSQQLFGDQTDFGREVTQIRLTL
jgi:hypothetical protein